MSNTNAIKLGSKLIEELSKCLVMNHLNLCFESHEVQNAFNTVIKSEKFEYQYETPRKVIVVVGAGASYPIVPMADDAKEILKKKVNVEEKMFNSALERLHLVYQLKNEFETTLFALSRFAENEVRNQLNKMYSIKYPPLLQYEILAHLLKHKFIDAIINFNFDELLDQSIEDEFGAGEYYRIISDGDCPSNFEQMGTRCDFPVYIKPHGTASHKSTLRFTREDYYGLPTDISKFIKLLVAKLPVTLIVIGFSMKSFEFNHLLMENLSDGSEIFFINRELPPFKPGDEKLAKMNDGRLIPVEKSLGDVMDNLWQNIFDNFRTNFYVRSIQRHKITSKIFSGEISSLEKDNEVHIDIKKKQVFQIVPAMEEVAAIKENSDTGLGGIKVLNCPLVTDTLPGENKPEIEKDKRLEMIERKMSKFKDPEWIENYLRDRAIVELTLSIARVKGLVKINELADDRCGRYYSRYCEAKKNTTSLTPILGHLGMTEAGYSGELYGFRVNNIQTPDSLGSILNQKDFDENVKIKLTEKTIGLLTPVFAKALNSNKDEFHKTLKNLYDSSDSLIRVPQNNLYNFIFNRPTIIKTNTALTYYTHNNIVKTEDWNILLAISENGEWLLKPPFNELYDNKNLMLGLIVAEDMYLREINNNFETEHKFYRMMPWWEHNRHMTIVANKKEPIASICYMHRLRSPHINPVLLDKWDTVTVLDTFISCWQKVSGKKISNFELQIKNDIPGFLQRFDREKNKPAMVKFLSEKSDTEDEKANSQTGSRE